MIRIGREIWCLPYAGFFFSTASLNYTTQTRRQVVPCAVPWRCNHCDSYMLCQIKVNQFETNEKVHSWSIQHLWIAKPFDTLKCWFQFTLHKSPSSTCTVVKHSCNTGNLWWDLGRLHSMCPEPEWPEGTMSPPSCVWLGQHVGPKAGKTSCPVIGCGGKTSCPVIGCGLWDYGTASGCIK